MWVVNIYSEGDLLNDDYLQVNKHFEEDEDGHFFETYEDRFTCKEDIEERLDIINYCIKRLHSEYDFICKYKDKLIRLGSYSNLEV